MTEIQKAWADFVAADDAYLNDDTGDPEIELAMRSAGFAYFSIKQDGDTPLWDAWRLKMLAYYGAGSPIESYHRFDVAEAAYREAFLADGPGIMPPDSSNQGTQQ